MTTLASRSMARNIVVEWQPSPHGPGCEWFQDRWRFNTEAQRAVRKALTEAGFDFRGASKFCEGKRTQASVYPDSVWVVAPPGNEFRVLRRKLSALLGRSVRRDGCGR